MTGAQGFGEILAGRVATRQSQIVLGLDPDPAALWPHVTAGPSDATPAERAAAAFAEHCHALIGATAQACVAVKLQLARFELLGAPGRAALQEAAREARSQGLLVIADGKRGDIDVTAAAYAAALGGGADTPFGRVDGLGADMVTVNPLMGRDSVEPFVREARARATGVLVLVRTSNPGAGAIQDAALHGGAQLWEHLARMVDELGEVGEAGLADVGAVVGATQPGHLVRARELMPSAPLLLPGIGAQGGRVEDLAAAFAPGPAGGLVSASRSIADAHRTRGGEPGEAARQEAERLREAAWSLSERALA